MDMLHLSKQHISMIQPKSDKTYLEDDEDLTRWNKANSTNLEHHDPLFVSTIDHHFYGKYMRY